MIKWASLILVLAFTGFSADCKVIADLTEGPDTLMAVRSGKTVMSCVGNDQFRKFLVADSSLPACMTKLSIQDSLILSQKKSIALSDTALSLMVEVNKKLMQEADTLRKVIDISDTLSMKQDSVRLLQEKQLKICEDSKPTFMAQLTTHLAAFSAGALAVALLLFR